MGETKKDKPEEHKTVESNEIDKRIGEFDYDKYDDELAEKPSLLSYIKISPKVLTIIIVVLSVIGIFYIDHTPVEFVYAKDETAPFDVIIEKKDDLPISIQYTIKEGVNGTRNRIAIKLFAFTLFQNINIKTEPESKIVEEGTKKASNIAKDNMPKDLNARVQGLVDDCDDNNEFRRSYRFTMYKDRIFENINIDYDNVAVDQSFTGELALNVPYTSPHLDATSERFIKLYFIHETRNWVFNCNSLNIIKPLITDRVIDFNLSKNTLGPFGDDIVTKLDNVQLIGTNKIVFNESQSDCDSDNYTLTINTNDFSNTFDFVSNNEIIIRDVEVIESTNVSDVNEFEVKYLCKSIFEELGTDTFTISLD